MIHFQKKSLALLAAVLFAVVTFDVVSCSSKRKEEAAARQQQQQMSEQQQRSAIADIYIYGYPLLVSSVQRDISTQAKKSTAQKAPLNHFAHNRNLPTPNTKDILLPNVDMLTSSAWLDVSAEPMVLRLPSSDGRYYVLEMMNAWTDVFASLGPRTSGSTAVDFVITGPQWRGNLPFNTGEIKSTTNNVWILGHTQVFGSGHRYSELDRARDFQSRMQLMPLSQYFKEFKAPMSTTQSEDVDVKTPAVAQVAEMDAKVFFSSMAEEMKKNPPTANDGKIVETMKQLGLVPGESFVFATLPPKTKQLFEDGYRLGQERLTASVKVPHGRIENGWTSLVSTGSYGVDYAERAFVARTSLGASLIDDVFYQWADVDQNGQKLSGQNRYVLHFAPNQAPPVFGFWSLTVYNAKRNLVANSIHRYSLSEHESLRYDRDGSVDLYLQPTSPGSARQANWLPTPKGNFQVMARLYWPKRNAISGEWKMPGLQKMPEIRRLSTNP